MQSAASHGKCKMMMILGQKASRVVDYISRLKDGIARLEGNA
jgi:hypothetical protein